MGTERNMDSVIYYGVALKHFDELDFKYDALAGVRARYFSRNLETQSDDTIQFFEKEKLNYRYTLEQGKPLLWKVFKNKCLVQSSKYLPDQMYCVCFYNAFEQVVKKIYFNPKHFWTKTEYFDPAAGKDCVCSIAPKMINGFFAIIQTVYNKNGCVASPLYMVATLPPAGLCEAAAYTDKGMLYFTSQTPSTVNTSTEEKKGFTFTPADFNLTKNMNSTFDISFAPYLTAENGNPFDKEEKSDFSESVYSDTSLQENQVPAEESQKELPREENVKVAHLHCHDLDGIQPDTFDESETFTAACPEEPDKVLDSAGEAYKYYGALDEQGKRNGYGRTETALGRTAYEGTYSADMRQGFGTFYYKDGSVNYVGNWKQNQREGAGIGFRSLDGTVHIGKWHHNHPCDIGVRFDKEGNFLSLNHFTDGKRNGIGITINEDGCVVISNWKDDRQVSEKNIKSGENDGENTD